MRCMRPAWRISTIFVEVGTGDGKKLDPFEERIARVLGFFEDTAIELHPGVVASGEEHLFLLGSGHVRESSRVGKSTVFCGETGTGEL